MHPLNTILRGFQPFRPPLETLLRQMDEAYRERAGAYGFHCRGCTENCCLTLFYHHTWLEFLHLQEGFRGLPPDIQTRIRQAAVRANRSVDQALKRNEPVREMCPLNSEGLCLLYPYRPMICRLHGIPHEVRKPGQSTVYSQGCGTFTRQCGARSYLPFDRTPFYLRLAGLERELREALGISAKFKKTVAEMIVSGMPAKGM